MTHEELKKRIDIASGIRKADIVIKNSRIVNVYTHQIEEGDIAISDGMIAGIGSYEGMEQIDAKGKYAIPGLMDGHIHIESAYVTPAELGRLVVPHGTTTIVADPHEIANVCGLKGLSFMLDNAQFTPLNIKYVLPSCVPATPFEHAGAKIDAQMIEETITDDRIIGLGEFMDFPSVVAGSQEVVDKILASLNHGKLVDGHSPGLKGNELNAYITAGIRNDHECETIEDLKERISRGMYVLLREGSCCKNLRTLLKGVDTYCARRCVLCSDDRQPKTIFEKGHMENHLQICVEEGIDPITAIQMATINTAECFHLEDRGAIAPGLRADIVLVDDLKNFRVREVFLYGKMVAKDGKNLTPTIEETESKKDTVTMDQLKGSFHVKDFSIDKLNLKSKSDFVHVIQVMEGGVVTKKETATIQRTKTGDFVFREKEDIAKVTVIERHNNTGNVAVGLIKGYGIKRGAIALSIAHDSHNIIAVGVNNEEIYAAVNALIEQEGGMVLVENTKVLCSIPMPIGGLMSDRSGEWVDEQLVGFHKIAHERLKVSDEVEPIMTLCFMSLPVIPEIKITDMGIFDVKKFKFIPIEASDEVLDEIENKNSGSII